MAKPSRRGSQRARSKNVSDDRQSSKTVIRWGSAAGELIEDPRQLPLPWDRKPPGPANGGRGVRS